MKRTLLSALIGVMAGGACFAQSAIQITSEEDMTTFGGFQPLSISPNGRYLGGSTFTGNAFIYDVVGAEYKIFVEEDGSKFSESAQVVAINNEGVGVGFDDNGGCMFSIDGDYKVVDQASTQYPIVTLSKITEDLSVIVGYVAEKTFYSVPCYWENDTRIVLPRPTDEELGFVTFGCQAIDVSEDGSVILGRFVDRAYTYPMIIWKRQADGSYQYDPVWEGKFEPVNDIVMLPDGTLEVEKRGDLPYLRYQAERMSYDGKYVGMIIQVNNDDVMPPMQLGIYSIATGELELLPNEDAMAEGGQFSITGISNNRDVVGVVGDPLDGQFPFVFEYSKKTAQSLYVAFAEIPLIGTYEGWNELGNNWICTGITPDSKYITGYIIHPIEWAGIAYLIDTAFDNAGVEGIEADAIHGDGSFKYYSIDGNQHAAPVKGLNIIRCPDGTVKKSIIK